MERIVHIQVNPEQRLVGHGIEVTIEGFVVFVLQFAGLACPERSRFVDDVVFSGFYLFAVFPFLLLAESYGHGQEAAVLLQQRRDAGFFEELLAIIVDVEDNIGTAVGLVAILDSKLRTAVASPFHSLCTFLARLGDDFYLLGNHESRVEAQTEVADDGVRVVLVLLEEVVGARESYLIDVFVDFFGGQTNTAVGHGNGVLAQADTDRQVAQLAFVLTNGGKSLQFLRSINGVGHQFAQEYFVVTVQKLFNDGEDVFGRYPNVTFLHNSNSIL